MLLGSSSNFISEATTEIRQHFQPLRPTIFKLHARYLPFSDLTSLNRAIYFKIASEITHSSVF